MDRHLCNECAQFNWAYHLTRSVPGLGRDEKFLHEDDVAMEAIKNHRGTPRSHFLGPSDGWCLVKGPPYSGSYQIHENKSATRVRLGPRHSKDLHQRKCDLCQLIADAIQATSLDPGAGDSETSIQLCQLNEGGFGIKQLEFEFKDLNQNAEYDPPAFTVTVNFELKDTDTQRHLRFGFGLVDLINGLPNHAMLDRHQIDLNQIRHWLGTCKLQHVNSCRPDIHHNIANFKVIDVRNGRVIDGPAGCTYIALSYVWGAAKTVRLKTADIKKHQSSTARGSNFAQLDRETLPRTIRDAMFVVEALGEDYLWVDSLCITQDDEDEMQAMIDAMDNVYKAACLTIIAASGDNADAGLAGLYPRSRSIRYATGHIDGINLVSTERSLQINSSPWAKRAWTYQEYQFSTRSLIFIHDRVFLECASVTFGEANPDRPVSTISRGKTRSVDFIGKVGGLVTNGTASLLSYCHHVQEYTSRNLSYEGDILKAFSAILQDHSTLFGTRFCWGLPTQHFLDALVWTNGPYLGRSQHPLTRRTGLIKGRLPFPSWSWAGWIGQVHYSHIDEETQFGNSLQSYIIWPWDLVYNHTGGEEHAFQRGVLVIDVKFAVLDRSSLSNLDIMYCMFDNVTRWKTRSQECFLVCRVDAKTEAQDNECIPRNHILMAVNQDSTGVYYRSGLFRVQEARWINSSTGQKQIRLG